MLRKSRRLNFMNKHHILFAKIQNNLEFRLIFLIFRAEWVWLKKRLKLHIYFILSIKREIVAFHLCWFRFKFRCSYIYNVYGNGIRNFISGFAIGFGMTAAEVVVSLKGNYPDITLITAIPIKGQASRFNFYDRKRYDRLLEVADEVIVLSESYYPRCFLDRDEFMVNNSSKLIGYYDGREKGGTFYTIRKAMAQNIPIVNVFWNLKVWFMSDIGSIIIIVIVFRIIFLVLCAWWRGDNRNDFRRDR